MSWYYIFLFKLFRKKIPAIGQIWEWADKANNPFSNKDDYNTFEILDIKNNWVEFKDFSVAPQIYHKKLDTIFILYSFKRDKR